MYFDTSEDWYNLYDNCNDPSLPEWLKILVIISHLITFPVSFVGIKYIMDDKTHLESVGVNTLILMHGAVAEIMASCWYVSDHINNMWVAKHEVAPLEQLGHFFFLSLFVFYFIFFLFVCYAVSVSVCVIVVACAFLFFAYCFLFIFCVL